MIETLTIFGRRALAALRGFTPGQITAIVIGFLALIAAAVLLFRLSAAPMTPLYSNLTSEDAVAISLFRVLMSLSGKSAFVAFVF